MEKNIENFYDEIEDIFYLGKKEKVKFSIDLALPSGDIVVDLGFDGLVKEDNDKYIADSKKIFKNETFNKLSSFKVDSEYENSTFNIVLNDLKEVLSTRLDSISLSDIKSGGSLKFDESEVQDLFDNRIFNRVQEVRRSFRDSNDLNGLERLKEDVSNTRYSSDMIKDIEEK